MPDPTMPKQHQPEAELVTVTPRVLAGPGQPATALEVLDDAGWYSDQDPDANVHAWSPDSRVYVSFRPEGPDPVGTDGLDGRRTLWLVQTESLAKAPSTSIRRGRPRSATTSPPSWSPRS